MTTRLNVGSTSVDKLGGVLLNHANLILRHKLLDGLARKRPVDVKALGENRRCDQLVLRNFLVQLIVGVLIEENEIVRFLFHLPTNKHAGETQRY